MDGNVLGWHWLSNAAVGGLIVLSLGSLAARLCTQPVRRARTVLLTLLGALTVPWLGTLQIAPKWSVGFAVSSPVAAAPSLRGTGALRTPAPQALSNELAYSPAAFEEKDTGIRRLASAPDGRAWRRNWCGREWAIAASRVLLARLDAHGLHCRRGRAGFMVAARSVSPLAHHSGSSAGPAGDSRDLPRNEWAGGESRSPAREPNCRPAIHFYLGPSGDRAAWGSSAAAATPRSCGSAWLTSGLISNATSAHLEHGSPRGPCALLSALVLVASAATEALPGLSCRRPGRWHGVERRLRAVPGPTRTCASNRSGLTGAGGQRPRSNLYRRVAMLVQDHEPLEHRCRTLWSLAAAAAAAIVMIVVSGLSLDAAPSGPRGVTKEANAVQDVAKTPGDPKHMGETLNYTGTVKDKDTGKPIPGATVVVRRSVSKSDINRVSRRRGTPLAPMGPTRSRSLPNKLPSATSTSSWTWSTPTTPPAPGSATP